MNQIVQNPSVVDPIAEAIARAQAAAAAAVVQQMSPAGASVPTTAVAQPAAPARRITEADIVGQTMAVDEWMNVSEHGLILSKNKLLLLSEPIVGIDLEGVGYNFTIKYGNPAQYRKTYDRVTDSRGGSWADTVAMAQRVDNRAREYRSADLAMVLLSEAKAKGNVAFPVGTVCGYSVSTTGWAKWDAFITEARRKGISGKVKVQLGVEVMNRNSNIWGVITYTYVGQHEGDFPTKPAAA